MECGVIHNDNTAVGQFRQQLPLDPCAEDIRIDAAVNRTHSEQLRSSQRSGSVYTALRPPVALSPATPAYGSITVDSRHIKGKTAFIDIDAVNIRLSVSCYFVNKDTARFFIRLRMKKSFFYG